MEEDISDVLEIMAEQSLTEVSMSEATEAAAAVPVNEVSALPAPQDQPAAATNNTRPTGTIPKRREENTRRRQEKARPADHDTTRRARVNDENRPTGAIPKRRNRTKSRGRPPIVEGEVSNDEWTKLADEMERGEKINWPSNRNVTFPPVAITKLHNDLQRIYPSDFARGTWDRFFARIFTWQDDPELGVQPPSAVRFLRDRLQQNDVGVELIGKNPDEVHLFRMIIQEYGSDKYKDGESWMPRDFPIPRDELGDEIDELINRLQREAIQQRATEELDDLINEQLFLDGSVHISEEEENRLLRASTPEIPRGPHVEMPQSVRDFIDTLPPVEFFKLGESPEQDRRFLEASDRLWPPSVTGRPPSSASSAEPKEKDP
jgi:hypothetical protein